MSLLQMSLSGAVLIAAVIVVRALMLNILPKNTFLVLWGIVILRLLVPVSIPSSLSVYSLLGQNRGFEPAAKLPEGWAIAERRADTEDGQSDNTANAANRERQPLDSTALSIYEDNSVRNTASDTALDLKKAKEGTVFLIIWCAGLIGCMTYFAVSYLRCRLEFRTSLPVENAYINQWLTEQSQRRKISVRQSDRVSSPLTYGIIHPVILLPKGTNWNNTEQLQYVLTHEYIHIRRCDTLSKLLMVSALGIHWFNPAVWLMYVLFNRDVELSCDEGVVRRLGVSSKTAYAMTLIQMEAERSGLAPFCSGFLSKIGNNAMEERITAIMKIKKKSMFAGIVAAVLVVSVTTAFATSAEENKAAQTADTDEASKSAAASEAVKAKATGGYTDFTEQDYEKLLELQFENYEDMSISAFRDKVWKMTDTQEYNDLLERFFQDENPYQKNSFFLYQVLGPLMDENRPPVLNGYAETNLPDVFDNAVLEYAVTLDILNPDVLTVHEYITARRSVTKELGMLLEDMTITELRDTELMQALVDEAIVNITWTYNSQNLKIGVEYSYMPPDMEGSTMPDSVMDDWQKERRDAFDSLMEPYVAYGLTYNYDWDTDDYKMYFQGKEVRGIYDEGENLYISEHIGSGKGIYAEDAVELFAVYEDGVLTGLRKATAQEMEERTKQRQAVTDAYESEQEGHWNARAYPPATSADYQSLLALKTPDYRAESIAEFGSALLEWVNEDYDRMERIGCDLGWNECSVALTSEEMAFVSTTAWLSMMENAAYVRSLQKNEPQQDVCVDITLPGRQEYATGSNANAWCTLWYTFSYHISDREKVSVGRRDDQIGGMTDEIQDYWESTELAVLLQMTEDDILEKLHSIAAKYSSVDVAITIMDDQVSYECMDERE